MITLWMSLAVAAPGWQPIGPERGHVVDFSVGQRELLAATRVGVMKSAGVGTRWERAPEFPPSTRRLTSCQEGSWAAPPGQLWEVTDEESRLVKLFSGGIAVDMECLESGSVVVAVRGEGSGVWTVRPGGEAKHVLPHIDAWVVATTDDEAWVGTVDQGLWHSSDGEDWEQLAEGAVSAIGIVDGDPWVAFADGRVVDWENSKELVQIPGGHATHIAGLSSKKALLNVSSQSGQTGPLQLLIDGELQAITQLKVDEDVGLIGPTGVWPLGNQRAMVGTFRRGPLIWDGERLTTDRQDFRAMVSGGAAIDSQNRLLIAAMGTGAYLWEDGIFGPHVAGQGPVTDAVAVKKLGDRITVLDFEGIVQLGEDGKWARTDGVPDFDTRRRNGFVDIAMDGDGQWWALDPKGNLYTRADTTWKKCSSRGVLRLDGDGDHLVFATDRGFFAPDCQRPTQAFEFAAPPQTSRALRGWVATPSKLFGGGQERARLPPGDIQAMALSEKGLLVAIEGQELLQCAPQCAPVASKPPSEVMAIGWMPNGDIWAMESKGTLLLAQENAQDPGPWSHVIAQNAVDWSKSDLLKNPWMHHQSGGQVSAGPPPQHPSSPPNPSSATPAMDSPHKTPQNTWPIWLFRGLGLALCTGIALYFIRRRQRL